MEDERIPGLEAAVVWHGRIVFERSYGTGSLAMPVPVSDTTLISINSITKAFTGVEAMKLVQAGKLDLAAPISAYLAGLPESWRKITIRQLLTHMSGLPDIDRAPAEGFAGTTEDQIWNWVLSRPVSFPAGERFSYCQTNYTLLQRVINQLNGRDPETPLAWPQFRAAAMTHSRYGDSSEVIPNGAVGYVYRYAKPSAPGVLHPVYELFRPFFRASSGIYSTADDMAHWMLAIEKGRILSKASLETLWTPAAFNDGRVGEWALGWEVLRRPGHRTVGMTGGGRSAFFLYPEDDLGVVILTTLSGASPEDWVDEVAEIYGIPLSGVPVLRAALERQGYQDGPAAVAALRRANPQFDPAEDELNDWGYRLLSTGRPRQALEVLRIVPQLFPRSGNAYDSFGEALQANGQTAEAISAYRRSLELDPKNRNAADWLRKLSQTNGASER